MSKFSNLLKLIILLKSKGRMKTKELGESLGVSERMIRKYISDLNEANIQVQSIQGPKGGYEIIGYDYLLNLDIDDNEKVALQYATKKLKEDKKFQLYNELESLEFKITALLENSDKHILNTVILPAQLDIRKQNEIEIEIEAAIIRQKKIKVGYTSMSSGKTVRILRPYKVIIRKNNKYLIAFCENRNKVITLKLVRFDEVEILDENFQIPEELDITKYLENEIGVFSDEVFNLKLLIRMPFAQVIQEGIYAKNQEIVKNIDDDSIVFTGQMRGRQDIIRWILSMMDSVTVIEPKELKEDIRNELIKILSVI
jgi:predicted DNA-binding transcriptional regulator YafY